jgi:hypothetical protein
LPIPAPPPGRQQVHRRSATLLETNATCEHMTSTVRRELPAHTPISPTTTYPAKPSSAA